MCGLTSAGQTMYGQTTYGKAGAINEQSHYTVKDEGYKDEYHRWKRISAFPSMAHKTHNSHSNGQAQLPIRYRVDVTIVIVKHQ
jgi:hypothetical protein